MSRRRSAVNHEVMHEINRAIVLSSLRENPSLTRAKLSSRTGLTRSAISNLTDELIQNDMIQEVGYEESTGGRRGILLELNPQGAGVIAIKFNASSVQCALANLAGEIDWYKLAPIDSTEESYVLGICRQLVQSALQVNGGARPLLGIGVASPGLIGEDGEVIYSKFMDWRNVSFRAEWEEEFAVPVSVDNLVSLAALGENHYGPAAEDSHFMYIEIGYGAGAGIVINNQLYQGKYGFAGEVGYMSFLEENGTGCAKTRNWQSMVNIPRFVQIARQHIESDPQRVLDPQSLTFSRLLEALHAGDEAPRAAMSELSRNLGMGLASLYNAFDIPVFVLGGELGREFGPFLGEARAELERHLVVMPPCRIDLRISRLQPDAALLGAVARVFDIILVEPSLSLGL